MTTAVYDLAQLAERDALTKIVLETLAQALNELKTLPTEIGEMLEILPLEVRTEVEADLAEDRHTAVLDDVRSIILDALSTKRGHAA